jgi:ketosteroid isomerase-like protein
MAGGNLELVRSIYAGWGRGDFSSTDWADPQIEFIYAGGPEPASWTGVAAMDERWREWLRDWVGFRAEALRYVVIDDSRVLAIVRNTGRGKASGVELDQQSVGNLFEIRDGRVTKLVVYLDFALARADLGLEK